MIYTIRYRLVQLKKRFETKVWNNMEGLVDEITILDCCEFLPQEFDTIGEAYEFKNTKAYPEDYVVANVW